MRARDSIYIWCSSINRLKNSVWVGFQRAWVQDHETGYCNGQRYDKYLLILRSKNSSMRVTSQYNPTNTSTNQHKNETLYVMISKRCYRGKSFIKDTSLRGLKHVAIMQAEQNPLHIMLLFQFSWINQPAFHRTCFVKKYSPIFRCEQTRSTCFLHEGQECWKTQGSNWKQTLKISFLRAWARI